MTKSDRCKHYITAFKLAAAAEKSDVLPAAFEAAVKAQQDDTEQTLESAAIYVANKVRMDIRTIDDHFCNMHEVFNWANANAKSSLTAQGVLLGLQKLQVEQSEHPSANVFAFFPPESRRA